MRCVDQAMHGKVVHVLHAALEVAGAVCCEAHLLVFLPLAPPGVNGDQARAWMSLLDGVVITLFMVVLVTDDGDSHHCPQLPPSSGTHDVPAIPWLIGH